MSNLTIVLVTLLAVFVGITIPVLLQLRSTLREMQKRMQSSGARLDRILEDSQVVADRLARVSGGLEGGEDSVRDLVVALGELSKVAIRTTSWMGVASSVGAAIGPAVAAAVHAFRSAPARDETESFGEDESTSTYETAPRPVVEGDAIRAQPGPPGREPQARVEEPFDRGFVDVDRKQYQPQERSRT